MVTNERWESGQESYVQQSNKDKSFKKISKAQKQGSTDVVRETLLEQISFCLKWILAQWLLCSSKNLCLLLVCEEGSEETLWQVRVQRTGVSSEISGVYRWYAPIYTEGEFILCGWLVGWNLWVCQVLFFSGNWDQRHRVADGKAWCVCGDVDLICCRSWWLVPAVGLEGCWEMCELMVYAWYSRWFTPGGDGSLHLKMPVRLLEGVSSSGWRVEYRGRNWGLQERRILEVYVRRLLWSEYNFSRWEIDKTELRARLLAELRKRMEETWKERWLTSRRKSPVLYRWAAAEGKGSEVGRLSFFFSLMIDFL